MRVELALIVGIVFFCCWCAYIIIRMNLTGGPFLTADSATSSTLTTNQQQQQASRQRESLLEAPNAPLIRQLNQNQHQHQQQQQVALAASQLLPAELVTKAQLASFEPASYQQPRGRLYLPASGYWRPSNLAASGRQLPLQQANFRAVNPARGSHSNWAPMHRTAFRGSHSEVDPNPDGESYLGADSQLAAEEAEAEEPDEEQQQPQTELEEQLGSRKFSESQQESNERDENGKPIVSHHRHLINGRPVDSSQQSVSESEFDSVVGQIEGQPSDSQETDYDEQPDPAERQQQEPEESRVSKTQLNPNGEELDDGSTGEQGDKTDEVPKRNQREEHKHDVKESLKAKQWNDDSSTAGDDEEALSQKKDAREEMEQETSQDPIEFRDLDKVVNSSSFPFMETSDEPTEPASPETVIGERRRKRELEAGSDELDTNSTLMSHQLPLGYQVPTQAYLAPQDPEQSSLYVPPNPEPADRLSHLSYPSAVQFPRTDFPQSPFGSESESKRRRSLSSTKSKKKKKKKSQLDIKKKKKKNNVKYKAAAAEARKRKSKLKKGHKRRHKVGAERKLAKESKEFEGASKGAKGKRGGAQRGAKKGEIFYKDKGYKKKGFKKAYQKLESGDHKTYFDEFRDKDHKKKWKNFNDKRAYSERKKWAGKDRKKYKNLDAKQLKDRRSKVDAWREKSTSSASKNSKYKLAMKRKKASKGRRGHLKSKKIKRQKKEK